MSWAMVGGAAISVVGGSMAANSQKKAAQGAANAQERGNELAIAEQQRQYDQTRQDQQPWMQAGQGALGEMQALNSGDFSSFTNSPDYQFARDQGLQGLDRSAAARGSLGSGGHSADVMGYAGGLASQNYNNYYNRLSGLAGAGQTTATGLGSLGQNMASNIGGAQQNIGNARASSYAAKGNANSQLYGLASGIGTGMMNNAMSSRQGQQQTAQPAQQWGTLAPSNGSNWNFGGGN